MKNLLIIIIMLIGSIGPQTVIAATADNVAESSIEKSTDESANEDNKDSSSEKQIESEKKDPSVAEVEKWSEFVEAYNNANVHMIRLMNNISGKTKLKLTPRTESLKVEGNQHQLSLLNISLPYAKSNHQTIRLEKLEVIGGPEQQYLFESDDKNAFDSWKFETSETTLRGNMELAKKTNPDVSSEAKESDQSSDVEDIEDEKEISELNFSNRNSTEDASSSASMESVEAMKESSPEEKESDESESKDIKGNTVEAANYEELKAAIANPEVSLIKVTEDIQRAKEKNFDKINRSLKIDGQNHKIAIGNQEVRLNIDSKTPADQKPVFTIENATLDNNESGHGFVTVDSNGQGKYTLNFKNITTQKGSVQLLTSALKCQVNFAGKMNLQTKLENAEVGSLDIAPGTNYVGEEYGGPWSMIAFDASSPDGSTGANRTFEVGDGATVDFKTTDSSSGDNNYELIFGHYKKIIIGEKATFNARWGHDIFRFDGYQSGTTGSNKRKGAEILIKENADVSLDNRDDTTGLPPINADSGEENLVTVEKDAKLKITTKNIYGAIALDGGHTNFVANSPKLIDLKNYDEEHKVVRTTTKSSQFDIKNTSLSYWRNNIDSAKPEGSRANIDRISSVKGDNWESVPPELGNEMNSGSIQVQRIRTEAAGDEKLKLASVPKYINFGEHITLNSGDGDAGIQKMDGRLVIQDSRFNRQPWQLKARLSEGFGGPKDLNNILYYGDRSAGTGSGNVPITTQSTKIISETNTEEEFEASKDWNDKFGLNLQFRNVGNEIDLVGKYSGTITWELEDAVNPD
ncbi:pectate lyase-like adhesive domain-containing protein [Pediococcus argentinicus]|nr:pectate lyase-like adhesive domain-containing protein [Pediococcus argentinicus]NKZ22859.1 hypothetical protein [Pediococcus argentinicus]GEP19918.1 hypothetical protein LSA03_13020 [Pediococcus argentinicus]